MYPTQEARELAILMRISRDLDICGDVTATVDDPSELVAWATILTRPSIRAWRAHDSGNRYLQIDADHHRQPLRGHVAAILACEHHLQFWAACELDGLQPGETRHLSPADLAHAWEIMPANPPGDVMPPPPPSAGAAQQLTPTTSPSAM